VKSESLSLSDEKIVLNPGKTILYLVLFALSIAGASVAYFTDVESATNVFTAGDVDITLTYANNVADLETAPNGTINIENKKVYPSQNFDIDATITNVGTEDAYVGAIITLTGMDGVIAATSGEKQIPVAVREFLVGLVTTGYKVKMAPVETNKITIYVIREEVLVAKDTTQNIEAGVATIFTDVTIPKDWDNAEMEKFSGFTLDVKAYATQTGGFDDAEEAIIGAFGEDNGDWKPYSNITNYDYPTN
jgi:predicted ribosomally synthesized peptide with SipW-like signal peptide